MQPNNTGPWWGPSKPLVVSDPDKLSYFARAAMVRSGLTAGRALNGANVAIESGSFSGANVAIEMGGFRGATVALEPRDYEIEVSRGLHGLGADANPAINPADVRNSSGSQTADSWLNRLGQGVGSFVSALLPGQQPGTGSYTAPPLVPAAVDDTVLGLPPAVAAIGGALLLGGLGYVVYKAVK